MVTPNSFISLNRKLQSWCWSKDNTIPNGIPWATVENTFYLCLNKYRRLVKLIIFLGYKIDFINYELSLSSL